ncbi:MAG: cupin domain-containing protein [Paracoccaceae bacterium]
MTGAGTGPYRYQLLSDPGGLTQFGAFIEELPPGSRSGHRHWHETEDEMIMVLSGQVVLVEDNETLLHAGDVAAWAAGSPLGHRLDNRSAEPAQYLVIGTRNQVDRIHYSDYDLITEKEGSSRRYLRRDGTPFFHGV